MSALASRIEAQGIATTTIGLVRPHMEQSRPPRGLWVPFQLGRPLGEAEDKAFQRRVLIQALHLLERTDGGPIILEDFPDDPPSWTDAEQDRRRPFAALREHLARADVAIPVPQAIHILGLVAADLTLDEPGLGALGALRPA